MSKFIQEIALAVLKLDDVERVVQRASSSLPQTTTQNLFRATGAIKLIDIVGEVTTVIQTQANNTKLTAVDDVTSTATDLCAVLNISAKAAGSFMNITGTLANAMVNTAGGTAISQAGAVVVPRGVIRLDCAASNTGAIKWSARYKPLEPGARLLAV